MTLSKDPKRSERMRHEETRIISLVEGTVNAKTCKWKHICCLFKEQWSGQYDWSREEEWEMRVSRWRMVIVQGRKAKVSSNCHARYIMYATELGRVPKHKPWCKSEGPMCGAITGMLLLTIPKQHGPNRWRERTQPIPRLWVQFALAVPLATDNAWHKISSSYEWRNDQEWNKFWD